MNQEPNFDGDTPVSASTSMSQEPVTPSFVKPPKKSLWRRIFGDKLEDTGDIAPATAASSDQVLHSIANTFLRDYMIERKSERKWKRFKKIGISTLMLIFFLYYLGLTFLLTGQTIFNTNDPVVGVVKIVGAIGQGKQASADEVVPALTKAFEKSTVKAVVLSIDSPGGAPVESERINSAIRNLKKKHPDKPLITVIDNLGASAAYMIAMEGDRVVAGRYSLVGSIGAVIQSWDVHKVMEKLDVKQKTFASGEFKSLLNPFVPPSEEGDKKAQFLVDSIGVQFKNDMVERRKAKLKPEIKYDTGEVWTGVVAKDIGLVDELGTVETIVAEYEGMKAQNFGPFIQKSLMQRLGAAFTAQDLAALLSDVAGVSQR